MSLSYRPEIDGLRSLAIGSVLIYHLSLTVGDSKFLAGGFLGVDVFFVISGYLITRIILTEALSGTFTYRSFYERRARRLLPSLMLVLLASSVAATLILHPGPMTEFAASALGSIFFLSNIYWDLASQRYGASSGLFQPLLHTWSLAVEEQFYLLFPVFVFVALRFAKRHLLVLSCLLALIGLGCAEVLTRVDHSLSFYWLMSRIWEMMVGAILAQMELRRAEYPTVKPADSMKTPIIRCLPTLGLAMIVLSLFLMDLSIHHPGIGTVPTVLGTALIIGFANPSEPVTRLFATKPLVSLGLISYALYLWHYPIYAFGRLLRPELNVFDYAAWIALSLLLAWLTYRYVEKGARHMALPRILPLLGGAVSVVSVFAAVMLATGGMRERLPGLIALYGDNEFDKATLADQSWGPLTELAAKQGMARSTPSAASAFERSVLWFDPQSPSTRVLVVGDSHGKDMYNVLSAAAEAGSPLQVARYGLTLPRSQAGLADLQSAPNFRDADIIALSFRYYPETLPNLELLLDSLTQSGKEIILFSNAVEFPEYADFGAFDLWLKEARALDVKAFNDRAWSERSDRPNDVNFELQSLAKRYSIQYLGKGEFTCVTVDQSCHIVTPDGKKALYDYGHYTLDGAVYFGQRVNDLGWFSSH